MAPIGTRFFSETSAGFLYIPAVALGYIYSLNQNIFYLAIGLFALASAVFRHGLLNAISGPHGVEEAPLRREEKYKRIQAAIWDTGGADDYPPDLLKGFFNTPHRSASRYYVIILLALALVGVVVGYVIATGFLINNINELDYVGVILLFLLLLWLLRAVLWRPWSSVYLVEERMDDRPDSDQYIQEEMRRFGYFIRDETDLHGTHVDYQPKGGGVFHIEFESDLEQGEVRLEDIDTIAQGFVAFQQRIEIPIDQLDAFIKYGGNRYLRFAIEETWVNQYNQGELDYDEYREKIVDTVNMSDLSE